MPEKTRWFLIAFFWDGLDWAYHTKESLSGDIYLPDKNSELYIVTRDEPTSAHTSLGMQFPLNVGQSDEWVVITEGSHLFASQMGTAKCDKTACLNCFNTSFCTFIILQDDSYLVH